MTRDLMFGDEIQDLVVRAYAALETPDSPAGRFYRADQLAALSGPLRSWALGVGNPVVHARPAPGETILDLGCGAGVDLHLARDAIGAEGVAIGVDMLASMVDRARRLADEAGRDIVFLRAEMEDLPIPDETVDVVISNGAINLSARKSRVLAEAHRVLRPGGRLCVADLTLVEEDLPPEILTHPSAWAG